MKQTIAIVIAGLILIGLSFWAGTFLGRSHTIALEASYRALVNLHMLDRLHAGDTNRVATVLDGILDQDTVAIGKSLDRPLLPRARDQIDRVIPRIQVYRKEYPRRPPESVRYDVSEHAPEMEEIMMERVRYVEEINETAERVLQHKTD